MPSSSWSCFPILARHLGVSDAFYWSHTFPREIVTPRYVIRVGASYVIGGFSQPKLSPPQRFQEFRSDPSFHVLFLVKVPLGRCQWVVAHRRCPLENLSDPYSHPTEFFRWKSFLGEGKRNRPSITSSKPEQVALAPLKLADGSDKLFWPGPTSPSGVNKGNLFSSLTPIKADRQTDPNTHINFPGESGFFVRTISNENSIALCRLWVAPSSVPGIPFCPLPIPLVLLVRSTSFLWFSCCHVF